MLSVGELVRIAEVSIVPSAIFKMKQTAGILELKTWDNSRALTNVVPNLVCHNPLALRIGISVHNNSINVTTVSR